jgi:hypothetical protein
MAVGVPGLVRGFDVALKRWGTRYFDELAQPAIALAEDGWAVDRELSLRIHQTRNSLGEHARASLVEVARAGVGSLSLEEVVDHGRERREPAVVIEATLVNLLCVEQRTKWSGHVSPIRATVGLEAVDARHDVVFSSGRAAFLRHPPLSGGLPLAQAVLTKGTAAVYLDIKIPD